MSKSMKTDLIEIAIFMLIYILLFPVSWAVATITAEPLVEYMGYYSIIPSIILGNYGAVTIFLKLLYGINPASSIWPAIGMIVSFLHMLFAFVVFMFVRKSFGIMTLKK